MSWVVLERVNRTTQIVVLLALSALFVLAWAPWLDDQAIHDMVFDARAHIDGTVDKQTGELLCDYRVMWCPFGRWVASCEGGYFVTFWGTIL
jgi:hypothetical protein